MRIIFMGTPAFAVPTLAALTESRHEVVAVYTQPDAVKGRGKKLEFPPVKVFALEKNIPVYQPERVRRKEIVEEMRTLQADCIVVAAFGQILPKSILEMTKYGCINVHASLLPAYRGAAPIEWAILNGEDKTGITIMQMDAGLDTGDILLTEETEITAEDTGDGLTQRLSMMGGPLLLRALDMAEAGQLTPVKQGETTTMYAKMLDKSMGHIDFSRSAEEVNRQIRAFTDRPSAFTYLDGKLIKVSRSQISDRDEGKEAGTILEVTKKTLLVQCAGSSLYLQEVQPEGKKRMEIDAWLRGYHPEAGMSFT